MLQIRADQLRHLGRLRFCQQAVGLYPALEARFPETCLRFGETDVIAQVSRVLERAFDQGFCEAHHASILADLALRFGEDFGERLGWAREVLTATHVDADLRASELLNRSHAVSQAQHDRDDEEPEQDDVEE
jgi:hypothetical protein